MSKIEMPSDIEEMFPDNSHSKKKEEAETKKHIKKVVKGQVTLKKKGFGRKIQDSIIGEDVSNVQDYVVNDILIPSAKSTISDIISSIVSIIGDVITGGIDMALYGETRPKNKRHNGGSYVSYNSISSRRGPETRNNQKVKSKSYDDIILDSRGEAEEVLSNLVDLISDYGTASVADLNEMLGISGPFTDNYWGWTDLSSAYTKRVSGGYMLCLPRVESLK